MCICGAIADVFFLFLQSVNTQLNAPDLLTDKKLCFQSLVNKPAHTFGQLYIQEQQLFACIVRVIFFFL